MAAVTSVSPGQLDSIRQSGKPVDLIDVRSPVEFRETHVPFARNVPFHKLDPQSLSAGRDPAAGPVYVICQGGVRSVDACRKLMEAGLADVVNVEGGTRAWEAAGLPVVRGKKAFSIQRQVQITAGTLALAGAVLGAFVHPYFIALPAFIGAGLLFTGLTNTCGMAYVLARMPWNQGGGSCE